MVIRIKRRSTEKDDGDKKDRADDKRVDVAIHKIRDLTKSSSKEFKELERKWEDLYERYELEKRAEELEQALVDLDKFVKKHPRAGVALGAMAGYSIASLFGRRR